MKTIRRGDRGKEVKTAQQLLNHKGYGAGSVDGIGALQGFGIQMP